MKRFIVVLVLALLSTISYAQTVTIDHNTQRYLGTVSELDRKKYFVLHSSRSDQELNAFYNEYNVTKGRFFWGPYSYANSVTGTVGNYPADKNGPNGVRQVVPGLVSTEHPRNVIRYNLDKNAAAAWAVEYFKDYLNDDGRPEIFEPMNEPFVHAGDDVFKAQQPNRDLMLQRMADWFGEIGKQFDQTPELANVKVIGYSSAWPSLERWNFGHWNQYQKMFMDRAGNHMDGFATHLYDGINVTGQNNFRSGSNSEAILDMIEAYSFIKWGVVKPHAITEYGGIERGFGDGYSDLASAQALRSFNHMIFNLLERENDMLISIPFITDKSTWHLTPANNYQPYGAVLFKPTNIGQANPAGWEYTPRVHFFELWREFKGKRVAVNSENPDIQVQAFANNNKLYVALNNADSNLQNINLNFVNGLIGLQNVRIKSLKVYEDKNPVFTNLVQNSSPANISLIDGETVTLEYTFANNISFNNALRSTKYYTNSYLQAISAGAAQSFSYSGVSTGSGKASLRMTIGRKHTMSKAPLVKVNGTSVTVPSNWTGYDQATRDDFFGTIVIPVPITLLSDNTRVSVEFPDNGGHLASMILQVEKYDHAPIDPPTSNTQQPYKGVAAKIPGVIKAVEFDLGGQGVAYNDSDTNNNGPNVLRENESVDIESRDGTATVGWTSNGEWLEYTVNANAGTYDIDLRYATISTGKAVTLKLDDVAIGTFNLANTGDWGTFQTMTLPNIALDGGGDKILRLEFIGGSTNINWLQFNSVTLAPETVGCSLLPETLSSSNRVDVAVNYSANQTRDVVVELWKGATYISESRNTVNAGTGTSDIVFNLNTPLANGNDYLFKTHIRPVGAGYQNVIASCGKSNISVLSCDLPWSSPNRSITQETVTWASEPIDINCASAVKISMDIEGLTPELMEAADYLNISYAIDGGEQVFISQNTDGFALKTISAENIRGSSLVLYINGKTSWQDETYNITNIVVEQMP